MSPHPKFSSLLYRLQLAGGGSVQWQIEAVAPRTRGSLSKVTCRTLITSRVAPPLLRIVLLT